jgi:hypothetical protein
MDESAEFHASALRRLLRMHLEHARAIGLLVLRKAEQLEAFSTMSNSWNRNDLPPGQRFAKAVESAKRFFSDDWRFRSVHPNDRLTLCRVVRVRDLKYPLNDTNRRGNSGLAKLLREFDALAPRMDLDAGDPSAQTELAAIARVLLDLRCEIILASRMLPYDTLASAVHGNGSCWVSLSSTAARPASSEAQFWRDRLGLHHLPQGTTLGDQLVKLTFVAELSRQPCPATFADYYAAQSARPDDIWLARPSVGDVPNPRFVQATSRDSPTLAADTGATIDLSEDTYNESEDELVLLRGRNARLEWADLELLEGWPQKHTRDDDHNTFVDLIKHRHAGLSS